MKKSFSASFLPFFALLVAICAILTAGGVGTAAAPDGLGAGFHNPPLSARPWVYYMIMDGNFTREGITADFEAMQLAGIGGMIIMEVNNNIPRGPVEFMSAEWRQLFKHAVAEAERLGLQVTLNSGPGWTGSGGPWVKPEQSMQHIVAGEVEVTGPAKFDAVLPRPAPRPPYFGSKGVPEEILKAKDAFYADVAVLAVPKTDDASRIADIDEKAIYLRHPYSSRPNTKPFLPAPANFPDLPANGVIAGDRIIDLTGKLDPQGRLAWDVPPGNWTILRFGRTSTGANTRPAPIPGLGLECDKFDKASLDAHFDKFVGVLLRDIGARNASADRGWTFLHIDSWEMGAQNWTAAFREEFKKRRGYDPMRYLPAVTGRVVDSLEVSERFLWDLRQTAQELVIENHARHLKELGRRHGMKLSIEPYDMNPCSDLSLGAVADVPMCEFWLYGFNTFYSVIEAASIAHTCGLPVVAAEAFTSSNMERWQAYPDSMKSLGDWAFCAGVNRIVFHRYQHQPQLDRRPGMTMGHYGVHWERTQTWWDMVPAYHAYLARCQFMLRQGLPVADVLYLAAEGAPHVFRAPPSATQGDPPVRLGYNFDGIAPEILLAGASVKDGRIALADGMSYRVMVLPERDTMTPALLRKVQELVEAGATVVGPRPVKSPSLSGYPKCDDTVKHIAEKLWADCDGAKIKEHAFGKGRIVWESRPRADVRQDTENPLKNATWIWHKGATSGVNAPAGTCRFRRTVTLDADVKIESAHAFVTADNSFDLFVNGNNAGSGGSFRNVYKLDIGDFLKLGENELVVVAANGGDAPNAAGLIGAIVVKLHGGRVLNVSTDRRWESSLTAKDGVWSSSRELGPVGMAPWKLSYNPALPEPDQYGEFAIVAGVLERMNVAPDFKSDGRLRYTHRHDEDTDIYFIANPKDLAINAECTFRVSGRRAELWNPVSGTMRVLSECRRQDDCTVVSLEFAPRQSWFVVFRKMASDQRPEAGTESRLKLATVQEITGAWNVSFDSKWGGPENATFDKLEDWTKRPESGIRWYSGKATYRKTFDIPLTAEASKLNRLFLDLGVVKHLAAVRLNGHDLGIVWCAPWRVDITDAVKPKDNHLEITVANLWPNRLIGDQSLPPEKRFTQTTWNPFNKDSSLIESGLLGPVTLRITAK